MDYMKDFFGAQQKMFESFQDTYKPFFETQKEGSSENMGNQFMDMQKKWLEGWTGDSNPFSMYQKMGDTKGFNLDAYKSFIDMQKMFFDNMQKFENIYPKGLGMYNFSDYNFNSFNEAFNQYKDMYADYDIAKLFDPSMSEVMSKMFEANKFYLQMYEFWNELSSGMKDSAEVDLTKFQDLITKNSSMAYDMLLSALPNEFKPYLSEPKGLVDQYFNTISGFYTPWKDELDQLRDLFVRGTLNNDIEQISDFFKLWKTKYNETFGKILSSDSFGVNKNIMEQQNKAFDKMIDMFIVASEFSTKLNAVQKNAFQAIIDEYGQLTKEGLEIKTFEEFFNFWSKKMDGKLIEYFGSQEFSQLLSQFGAAAMDVKAEFNQLMEYYLADTPIVTKGQLDSMIKKVYEMKKEIKSLKKEVDELKKSKPEEKK